MVFGSHKSSVLDAKDASPNRNEEAFEMQPLSQLGGTQNDERDMAMLGRVQVLNVSRPPP